MGIVINKNRRGSRQMSLKLQLTVAFLIGLVSAVGFACLALFVKDHKIAQFDTSLTSFVRWFETPVLTTIMKWFTMIGSGGVTTILAIVCMVFLYKVLHHRYELILLVWVVIGSALLNTLLKLVFQRARPILNRIIDANGYSFPSGHSMAAFSLYGILTYLLWRHVVSRTGRLLLVIVSVIMIFMIGISRVYLGVHYPSDVLGGYLASSSLLAISIWFYERFQEKRSHRQ
jgi:undecaprenyl-diphosphatase